MKIFRGLAIITILTINLIFSGEFSFGFNTDLLQQSRNEFSWNYERDVLFGRITTDTIYTMQLEDINPAFGVYIGYENVLSKKFNYSVEYGFSKMKYNYTFHNGLGTKNESYMKWSRHTVDIGLSYTLINRGSSKTSIGFGEVLTFVTPLISSNETDILNPEPDKGYKNNLSLNGRRGEYFYLMYQSSLEIMPFKYQLKLQLNYIDATFIDWFTPTIRLGIVFWAFAL